MDGKSLNINREQIEKLKNLFPEVVSEGKVDFEKLKKILGDFSVSEKERYGLLWANKSECFQVIQTPTANTLKPILGESIDFENTGNIFIEGENLEVLKILQRSYHGKIKMIYIDPPYNTGNDSFIYPDKFKENKADYKNRVADKNEDGYLLKDGYFKKNFKENGHYHSNWLSMMFTRLYLAKNLLHNDGVIFISIDDNEQANLKLLCDEIFGEENFCGQLVWQTATDNNPTQIATEHEYVVVYAKMKDSQDYWEIKSEKGQLIQSKYEELKSLYGNNIEIIQTELRKWIRKQTNGDDLSGVAHYSYVDAKGVFYPGNSANTKPGGYTYDIIHPFTKKVCAKPEYGYRWKVETFISANDNGDVLWGETEKTIPKIKKRLDTVTQKLKSYYYEDNRGTTAELKNLFDGKVVFNNPKSVYFLIHILKFVTNSSSIILDFFAGSGTTAHAVMQLNAEDGGSRKFICVQLPEPCDEKSEAYKAGYKTIADISKERIKKVIHSIKTKRVKLNQEKVEKPPLFIQEEIEQPIDLGVKVFKLSESNFEEWKVKSDSTIEEIGEQLKLQINSINKNSSELDILYELLIKAGFLLDTKIQKHSYLNVVFYSVENASTIFYLDKKITLEIVNHILELKPKFVFILDESFSGNDVLKTNTMLRFKDSNVEFISV